MTGSEIIQFILFSGILFIAGYIIGYIDGKK